MELSNHIAATDSIWSDVWTVLDALAETHGEECVERESAIVRIRHAEILADSDDSEEFERRFSDWLINLVGPTEA